MPEIPEVETFIKHLKNLCLNQAISKVEILRPESVNLSAEELKDRVINAQLVDVTRRAKFLIIHLENQASLLIHFMIEGYPHFLRQGEELTKTAQVILGFASGERLVFCRLQLGYLNWQPTWDLQQMPELAGLGPEPLDPAFTPEELAAKLRSRKGMIKPLLKNQQFIAGIGGAYSDECCFAGGIRPDRRASSLTGDEAYNLHRGIRQILREAIYYGGIFDQPFFAGDTFTGGYDIRLKVAYREGQPCPNCGGLVASLRISGKKSYYCPQCQK